MIKVTLIAATTILGFAAIFVLTDSLAITITMMAGSVIGGLILSRILR